ncbi:MAG TPA: tryptophan synthase subunit alpha [Dissulfurispiraceae bacterium]|nr:tryptophan synthase subunit alpha [Dissulfurispiraceae bacterium]
MQKTRISVVFEALRALNKKAFIPYLMAGDPDAGTTLKRVFLLERCGADIIELGVPFSDPLADGPTIQKAAGRALKSGTTLRKVLLMVRDIRLQTDIPLILMTYYNPVFKYGEEAFIKDAIQAGVDGLIVPDLPPEEAGEFIKLSRRGSGGRRLDTIFLIAPTSTPVRIKKIAAACSGFVYYVSITGITGASLELDEKFRRHLGLVKQATDKPVAVGFGIASPDQARMVAQIADGVIVGSALVQVFNENPDKAENLIRGLREAI